MTEYTQSKSTACLSLPTLAASTTTTGQVTPSPTPVTT